MPRQGAEQTNARRRSHPPCPRQRPQKARLQQPRQVRAPPPQFLPGQAMKPARHALSGRVCDQGQCLLRSVPVAKFPSGHRHRQNHYQALHGCAANRPGCNAPMPDCASGLHGGDPRDCLPKKPRASAIAPDPRASADERAHPPASCAPAFSLVGRVATMARFRSRQSVRHWHNLCPRPARRRLPATSPHGRGADRHALSSHR